MYQQCYQIKNLVEIPLAYKGTMRLIRVFLHLVLDLFFLPLTLL
jgi:hypothetical protein